jgi:mannose-6-phosphate isomerase-like protein (cupin superfamily)
MLIHDLGPEAVEKMMQVDLAGLSREPDSPIGQFSFHDCICGVGAFTGRPPWEQHTQGDELLLILAGESELTVLERQGPITSTLSAGRLVVVPQGHWHANKAPKGVTMLYLTPREGNEHSWEHPSATTSSS